jgi:hypothetical protein
MIAAGSSSIDAARGPRRGRASRSSELGGARGSTSGLSPDAAMGMEPGSLRLAAPQAARRTPSRSVCGSPGDADWSRHEPPERGADHDQDCVEDRRGGQLRRPTNSRPAGRTGSIVTPSVGLADGIWLGLPERCRTAPSGRRCACWSQPGAPCSVCELPVKPNEVMTVTIPASTSTTFTSDASRRESSSGGLPRESDERTGVLDPRSSVTPIVRLPSRVDARGRLDDETSLLAAAQPRPGRQQAAGDSGEGDAPGTRSDAGGARAVFFAGAPGYFAARPRPVSVAVQVVSAARARRCVGEVGERTVVEAQRAEGRRQRSPCRPPPPAIAIGCPAPA